MGLGFLERRSLENQGEPIHTEVSFLQSKTRICRSSSLPRDAALFPCCPLHGTVRPLDWLQDQR